MRYMYTNSLHRISTFCLNINYGNLFKIYSKCPNFPTNEIEKAIFLSIVHCISVKYIPFPTLQVTRMEQLLELKCMN